VLCRNAMDAWSRCDSPGLKEYGNSAQRGRASAHPRRWRRWIYFLSISDYRIDRADWRKPAMVFGNPRPSGARAAKKGRHIINMGVGRRYCGAIGADRLTHLAWRAHRSGEQIWNEILPLRGTGASLARDRAREQRRSKLLRTAKQFFRDNGYKFSRPTQWPTAIDLVTDKARTSPQRHVSAEKFGEEVWAGRAWLNHGGTQSDHTDGLSASHRPHISIRHPNSGHEVVDDFPRGDRSRAAADPDR